MIGKYRDDPKEYRSPSQLLIHGLQRQPLLCSYLRLRTLQRFNLELLQYAQLPSQHKYRKLICITLL